MRREDLRRRLEELYRQYDHRFVTPDPLEFVRAQATPADREVVGLLASGLAFGTVTQIKQSIATVLQALGPGPAEAVAALDPLELAIRLRAFRHRWLDGRDVACLLFLAKQMRASHGTVEAFFTEGLSPGDPDVGRALASFSARALALDHGGLYRGSRLPKGAGVDHRLGDVVLLCRRGHDPVRALPSGREPCDRRLAWRARTWTSRSWGRASPG